jgi:hypothetical protein
MSISNNCCIPCNKPVPYADYKNFGSSLNSLLQTDPVEYSIFDDPDSYFVEGPTASMFGPQSEPSQLYMAQKCSERWDGSCEYLSRNIEPTKENKATVSSVVFKCKTDMTVGDTLINNSAQRKYGRKDLNAKCSRILQNYNPNDPSSINTVTYQCGLNNIICTPPLPNEVEKDELLNKLLIDPGKHVNILKNFYINLQPNQRSMYKGTRLGNIFEVFDAYKQLYGCLD